MKSGACIKENMCLAKMPQDEESMENSCIFKFNIGSVRILNNPPEEYIFKSIRVVNDDGMIMPETPIVKYNNITIKFSYPLGHNVELSFESPSGTGFTRWDIWKCIKDGYEQIYREEHEAVGDPGTYGEAEEYKGTLLELCANRRKSNGPHGIWGHSIGDLYIEGIEEIEPAYYILRIGS